MIQKIALVAAIVLPLWNIPLIVRIVRRKSSDDVSLYWAGGVWVCLALMTPAGFISVDSVFRIFTIVNFVFFTTVVITVFWYRR